MIRHILTIIRNERKANTWILLEFIVVFCILWFCCDYLYYLASCQLENPGIDINHTYVINMEQTRTPSISQEEKEEITATFISRVKQHPAVEHLSFSKYILPYGHSSFMNSCTVNEDSASCNASVGWVTPEFFQVFKIPFVKGENFDESDLNTDTRVIISPNREGYFGKYSESIYHLTEVERIRKNHTKEEYQSVIGYIPPFKKNTYSPYYPTIFHSLNSKEFDLVANEISIRISPSAEQGFKERFMEEMKNQLELGPYYLSSVTSLKESRSQFNKYKVGDNLNSVLAITAFLIVNIFLGLIGTFWSRIQSRRSEIGLRIAMGSSKRKVKKMLLTETFLLLLIASIIGTIICLNIGQTGLLEALGIPLPDRVQVGYNEKQDFINYGITFGFLLIVSLAAVWYPATQAANVQPAESLRSE